MKKLSIEDRILLAQSGELSRAERDRLEQELERDPAARAYRADLDALVGAQREASAKEDVSDLTVERILRAAAGPARARPVVSWGPALAYAAAAVAVLVAGTLFLQRMREPEARQFAQEEPVPAVEESTVPAWDADLDAEIEALDEMLAMVVYEEQEDGSESESLEDLAEDLIELEGIEI